jgi:YHS domain-containing protein
MIHYKGLIVKAHFGIVAILLHVASLSAAQESDIRLLEFNVDESALAVQGYDVVSYFFDQPQKGKSSISYKYESLTYYFSSIENKEVFIKNPEKFEPAYGGWCSYAMGDSGKKVKIDPKTYKIIAGRLYLFYNFYFNNTLIDWNKDEANLMIKADENWTNILESK